MKKQTKTKEKKFFLKPEFKSLQEEWYAKLSDEGFIDTETIRDIRSNSVNQQVFTVNDQWAVYNDKCRAYLSSGKIVDAVDFRIFELHCDGISERETARLLTQEGYKVGYSTVRRKVLELLNDAEIERIVFKL